MESPHHHEIALHLVALDRQTRAIRKGHDLGRGIPREQQRDDSRDPQQVLHASPGGRRAKFFNSPAITIHDNHGGLTLERISTYLASGRASPSTGLRV